MPTWLDLGDKLKYKQLASPVFEFSCLLNFNKITTIIVSEETQKTLIRTHQQMHSGQQTKEFRLLDCLNYANYLSDIS